MIFLLRLNYSAVFSVVEDFFRIYGICHKFYLLHLIFVANSISIQFLYVHRFLQIVNSRTKIMIKNYIEQSMIFLLLQFRASILKLIKQ